MRGLHPTATFLAVSQLGTQAEVLVGVGVGVGHNTELQTYFPLQNVHGVIECVIVTWELKLDTEPNLKHVGG